MGAAFGSNISAPLSLESQEPREKVDDYICSICKMTKPYRLTIGSNKKSRICEACKVEISNYFLDHNQTSTSESSENK